MTVSVSDGIAAAVTRRRCQRHRHRRRRDRLPVATSSRPAPLPPRSRPAIRPTTSSACASRRMPRASITELRYFRGAADAGDTDTRTLNLWTAAGVRIGQVTVTSAVGASGWQVGTLTTPIAIAGRRHLRRVLRHDPELRLHRELLRHRAHRARTACSPGSPAATASSPPAARPASRRRPTTRRTTGSTSPSATPSAAPGLHLARRRSAPPRTRRSPAPSPPPTPTATPSPTRSSAAPTPALLHASTPRPAC